MKQDRSLENIRNFKNIKLETNKTISAQYVIEETNKFKPLIDNTKKIWAATKRKIYGENCTNIERIFYNNEFHIGSKKLQRQLTTFLAIKWKN